MNNRPSFLITQCLMLPDVLNEQKLKHLVKENNPIKRQHEHTKFINQKLSSYILIYISNVAQ